MDVTTLEIIFFIVNLVLAGIIGSLSAIFTIGQYKEKVDTLKTDVKDIKDEIKEIRDKAVACETSLKEREPLVRRKSPISLTERGQKVLEESGGKKFVDDDFVDLSAKVEEKNPKTAYDVQEFSKEIISSIRDTDKFNVIKNYLFKEGLEIDNVIEVLSIYLRDKVLAMKNLPIEDIDKYDPKTNVDNKEQ